MPKNIKFFDTTLRDGEQSPRCSMNNKEKLLLAKQLEKLGVDVIEAGFVASSEGDFESVQTIANEIKDSTVAVLARTVKDDIEKAWEALKGATKPRIHTFIATSDIHMKYKLKMEPEEVMNISEEMVKYASSLCPEVEFSAEDATRSDPNFLVELFDKVIKAGAIVSTPTCGPCLGGYMGILAKGTVFKYGDKVEVDFDSGEIINITKGETHKGQPYPEFLQKIIQKMDL